MLADPASGWGYGWDAIAAEVVQLRASAGAQFVATTDYALAGELGFALHDPQVTSLSPNTEAFDFWRDPAAASGATAVIVADDWRALPDDVRARFGSIEVAGSFDATVFGHVVDRYQLYIGRGFRPAVATP